MEELVLIPMISLLSPVIVQTLTLVLFANNQNHARHNFLVKMVVPVLILLISSHTLVLVLQHIPVTIVKLKFHVKSVEIHVKTEEHVLTLLISPTILVLVHLLIQDQIVKLKFHVPLHHVKMVEHVPML
jgi:hypothetical protein